MNENLAIGVENVAVLYPLKVDRKTSGQHRNKAAHNRLGGMMWAVRHASCQAARTPVELIESAGRFRFRLAVVDATLFTRSEWKERQCSSSYPQPL